MPLPARSNSVRRSWRPERRRHSCHWANQGKLRWATFVYVEPLTLTNWKLFLLLQVLHKIRQEKVKEFTWADIYRHLEQVIKTLFSFWWYDRAKKQLILETQLSIQFIFWSHNVLHLASHLISKCLQVLDLVPWREFSQSEFLEFVVPSDVLPQVFFSVMSCQRFKSGNGCCPL